MDITCENLDFCLLNGRKMLHGVTTHQPIQAGSMTAILGASGSAKTTFINTLSGRNYEGVAHGTIGVNGVNLSSVAALGQSSRVAVASQDDIMMRDMTVEENLLHAARCKLSMHMSDAHIRGIV